MEKHSTTTGIPWLLGELNGLVDNRIVSPEASTAIKGYYEPKALADEQAAQGQMHLYMTSLLAGLAALLIGGGMILILAYNWEDFSRGIRAAIAILPAIAGLALAAWVLACNKSRSWREFTGIWLILSAYSSLGIIAQTYHLGGKFSTFMMVVTLTTLFVPVLLRSLGANILQLISFIAWGFSIIDIWGSTEISSKILIFIGLLVALTPYYLSTYAAKNVWEKRFDSIALVITSYFLTPILLSNLTREHSSVFFLLLLSMACVQLLVGHWIKLHGDRAAAKPWHVGGWFGVSIFSIILSGNLLRLIEAGNPLSWLSLPIAGLVIYGIVRLLRKQWFEGLVGLLPLGIFCAMLLCNKEDYPYRSSNLVAHVASGPLLVTLVFTLFSILGAIVGYLKKDGGIFTGSMIVLILAIVVRFFDGDYSTWTRGLVFLAAGVVVLVINLLADRFFKNKTDSLTSDSASSLNQ